MVRAWVGLLAIGCLAWGQRQSDADAAALIERARQKALAYTKSLPDFECTEVVRRYTYNSAGLTPRQRIEPAPADKLTIRIRYSRNREEHKLILIDDTATDRTFESLQGAIGTGEFGATMSAIFDPATATAFRWESWKTERKRRVAMFGYTVDDAHSRYRFATGVPGDLHEAIVPYHGVLEVDGETGEVLHFSYATVRLPNHFMVQSSTTTVDYGLSDVGGQEYLLPARSVTVLSGPKVSARNEIEFREYHKFTADSSIEFGPVK